MHFGFIAAFVFILHCVQLLSHRSLKGLLERYLVASNYDVREALIRLEQTAKWRKEWNVLDYYRTLQKVGFKRLESCGGLELIYLSKSH